MRVVVLLPVVVVAMSGLTLIGCGGEPPVEAQADNSLGEAEESRALELYQAEACAACHGEMAQGQEEIGPALRDLAPYWDVDRLMVYLADPEGFRAANPDFDERRDVAFEIEMPAFDHLSEEQRRLLARWLLTR
jgi:mono/diheme cytochrome c family protein